MGPYLLNISNFKQTNEMDNIDLSMNLIRGVIQKVRHFAKQHFLTPVQLCHLLKNDKLWHGTKKCFFYLYMAFKAYHISKDVEVTLYNKMKNS